MRINIASIAFIGCVSCVSLLALYSYTPHIDPITEKLGGDTSRVLEGQTAFTMPAANIKVEHQRDFSFGNRLFNTNWIAAPASVKKFDGLGPLFNRVSCDGCHTQDGRGHPPQSVGETMDSMLLRLSVKDTKNGAIPHPVYGDQLSEQGILGVKAEGITKISFEPLHGTYGDGEAYVLQKPSYEITQLGYGDLRDIMISPRVAPQMIGLGLLEAIPESVLLRGSDPDDKNKDGISGRVNLVKDPVTGEMTIGRFGWKSNQPNLRTQNADAALGDLGLTSPLHTIENCTPTQTDCLNAARGDTLDLSNIFLDKLTLYTQLLAVPAQKKRNDQIIKGEKFFNKLGCSSCHTPTMTTDDTAILDELKNQTFHPFTDLMLHDMGTDLADNRPDRLASGVEWRTPPLWGIGHFQYTNGHQRLLHDGRADGVAEAILWHGGEGKKAREAFRLSIKTDRDALIAFLNSL
jgi:CxxC motif-containing protein (DUF1111 family)